MIQTKYKNITNLAHVTEQILSGQHYEAGVIAFRNLKTEIEEFQKVLDAFFKSYHATMPSLLMTNDAKNPLAPLPPFVAPAAIPVPTPLDGTGTPIAKPTVTVN